MTCNCMRSSCGLRKNPPKIDVYDAENMWLPNAYANGVKGSEFQKGFKIADITHQKQMVQPQYTNRLEAAQAYIADMLGGAISKGIEVLEGI